MALAAIRGEQALVELSQQFDVHANQIKQWKDQLPEGATGVFGDETNAAPVSRVPYLSVLGTLSTVSLFPTIRTCPARWSRPG